MAIGKFYITTPLYYVNDAPHIGHAYTTIAADVFARWHRLRGDKVFFLTGTDEHGEKVQRAAEAAGEEPKAFVDRISQRYRDTWKRFDISHDKFIRTTDQSHIDAVIEFVGRLVENGDVYKGQYEGWYCLSDETFYTELQLKEGKCPDCGREVKKVKEDSYFFRLSKYQSALLDLYDKNRAFLSPELRSQEIINRVKDGLKDISITRTTVNWAVPFPGDKEHYVYVWVDALLNYISALGWPGGTFSKFWPADVHVIGKEINWFHSVIWPAMLLSAGIEPPKMVFAHGWWTVSGKKMSKSLHNFVDPIYIAEKYSVDALRYFLVREMPFGEDGDFSEDSLVARINGELVADLGNLVYRVLTLAEKFDGRIAGRPELEGKLDIKKIDGLMTGMDPHTALEEIWSFIRSANRYVNENHVWNLEGDQLSNALYNLLEACRVSSILLYPFIPETAMEINRQLGTKLGALEDCRFGEFAGKPKRGGMLFRKVVQ
jgi:methionyl-tRNA synthetase